MEPGHEDCTRIADGFVSAEDTEPVALPFRCAHDHKAPITITPDLCSLETVGWHCHCCGRVWVDENYVAGEKR